MLWSWFVGALGVVGNLGFGFACLPSAKKAIITGSARGMMPMQMAWTIFIACIGMYGYILLKDGWDWFIGPIGIVETGCYATVLRYNYFPRRKTLCFEDGHDCGIAQYDKPGE